MSHKKSKQYQMQTPTLSEGEKKMSRYEKWSIRIAIAGALLTFVGICVGAYITILQVSISKSLQPKLQGHINEAEDGNVSSKGVAGLLISASISNLGSPSIVSSYFLQIKLAGESTSTNYGSILLPDSISGDTSAHFTSADALYEKTVHPIESGDQITGWLFFVLPNVTADQIHAKGTEMNLFFKDVTGKLYKSDDFVTTGKPGVFYYVPGGGQPFSSSTPSQ